MKTVCQTNQCTGCMACVDICPKGCISIADSLDAYNAVIDPQLCVDCGACTKVCQQNTPAVLHEPIGWYEGWAADPCVRSAGSSGGIAGALSLAFVNDGGAVCSCVFEEGEFCFRIARTSEEVAAFSGSKYIKSNPKGIYSQVKTLLKQDVPVLFIGLPCQCAAVKLFVGEKLQEGLHTADLICHGSPSPAILDAFLKKYGTTRQQLINPSFRKKSAYRFADNGRPYAPAGTRDRYLISFLNMLTFTENCHDCPYARRQRVSDLSLGDSWGSVLSQEEVQKGISLILCQTEKGRKLLDRADLVLQEADPEAAVASNHQLHHPSPRIAGREDFFRKLKDGAPFHKLVQKAFPKQCFRQQVKGLLFRLLGK